MSKKLKLTLLLLMLIFISGGIYYSSAEVGPPAASDKDADLIKSEGKALAAPPEKEEIVDHAGQTAKEEDPAEQQEPLIAEINPPEKKSNAARRDEAIVEQLSFLQSPIPGAHISSKDSQLPGAPRAYRNGTHEGLDYYQGYCGVPVSFGDPVYAAGAGTVIRVDHDFIELPIEEREEMLRVSAAAGNTPEHILDYLRGRQVWIDHGFGAVSRYAHLDTVSAYIQAGDLIEAGDIVGTVGNSGTSNGARGTQDDAHLHFEIWVENRYLGQGLPPEAVRLLWHEVLVDAVDIDSKS